MKTKLAHVTSLHKNITRSCVSCLLCIKTLLGPVLVVLPPVYSDIDLIQSAYRERGLVWVTLLKSQCMFSWPTALGAGARPPIMARVMAEEEHSAHAVKQERKAEEGPRIQFSPSRTHLWGDLLTLTGPTSFKLHHIGLWAFTIWFRECLRSKLQFYYLWHQGQALMEPDS